MGTRIKLDRGESRQSAAVRMHAAGATVREIGAMLDMDESTIRRWLHRAGVAPRPRGARRQATLSDDRLLAMREGEHLSLAEIGRRIGLTRGGVEGRLIAAEAARARAEHPDRDVDDHALVRARQAGASWSDLALMAGMSRSGVRVRVMRLLAQGDSTPGK